MAAVVDVAAALLRVTVQVPVAPDRKPAGEHTTEDRVTEASRFKVALCEALPSVAVTTAL